MDTFATLRGEHAFKSFSAADIGALGPLVSVYSENLKILNPNASYVADWETFGSWWEARLPLDSSRIEF